MGKNKFERKIKVNKFLIMFTNENQGFFEQQQNPSSGF